MQHHKSRGWAGGQKRGIAFIQPRPCEQAGGGACHRPQGFTGAIHHRERKCGGNIPPILPVVETGEIIRPHQPDEVNIRATAQDVRDRLRRIARADSRFQSGDNVPGVMLHQGAACRHPLFQRGQGRDILERVAGGDKPPDLMEPQAPQGRLRHQPMPRMRRVERATEEANPHSGAMGGEGENHRG